MQLDKSDELKFVMQVYMQETTFQGKPYEYERLQQFAHRYMEQKTWDSMF